MKRLVLVALCLLVGGMANAQGQENKSPFVLVVDKVTVGTHRIVTLYAHTAGRWSDAKKGVGLLSTDIQCLKLWAVCMDAEASEDEDRGDANVSLEEFDILRWDSNELIAVDSSPICVANTIRFDFRNKTVTHTSVPTGNTSDRWCKASKAVSATLEK